MIVQIRNPFLGFKSHRVPFILKWQPRYFCQAEDIKILFEGRNSCVETLSNATNNKGVAQSGSVKWFTSYICSHTKELPSQDSRLSSSHRCLRGNDSCIDASSRRPRLVDFFSFLSPWSVGRRERISANEPAISLQGLRNCVCTGSAGERNIASRGRDAVNQPALESFWRLRWKMWYYSNQLLIEDYRCRG